MESISSHLINCDNGSTEEPSLLMLNNDCIREIFQLLQEPTDYYNLAKTCDRLQYVARDAGVNFKEIKFVVMRNISIDNVTRSNEIFSNFLSMVGGYVRSIEVYYDANSDFFEKVRDNCQKLNRLELYNVANPPVQHFNNLRELKIEQIPRRANPCSPMLRELFTNNPNIENLEYNGKLFVKGSDKFSGDTFFDLLKLLPKMKVLVLNGDTEIHYLRNLLEFGRLPHLTKLSLFGSHIPDTILMELAKKSNLVGLEFDSLYSNNVQIINLFHNLEVLHLHLHKCCDIDETTVFPPKLRLIRFSGVSMSCNELLAIVKQLKFLEEFDLDLKKIWNLPYHNS